MTNVEDKLPVANSNGHPDKPGALALTVMNQMRDDVFKKPFPVAGAKRKHEILDEETYLEVSNNPAICPTFYRKRTYSECWVIRFRFLYQLSYVFQEIGRIIQRDFFPDLEKLKAQNAYLDAIENNDVIKLREIYSKYSVARQQPVDACKY